MRLGRPGPITGLLPCLTGGSLIEDGLWLGTGMRCTGGLAFTLVAFEATRERYWVGVSVGILIPCMEGEAARKCAPSVGCLCSAWRGRREAGVSRRP
jgi:hypothetical protein